MKLTNNQIFINFLISIGVTLFFLAVVLIIVEFSEANLLCSQENGDYSFSIKEVKHYCNGEEISRYTDGWDFVKFRPNLNSINISLP